MYKKYKKKPVTINSKRIGGLSMVNIIKDKEEVKSVMNIIQAFADGKTIQAIDPYEDEWVDQVGLNFESLFEGQYRIKPEPKCRPFANAEECWTEMLKHQPLGWITSQGAFFYIIYIEDKLFGYGSACGTILHSEFNDVLKCFTFADGTPFGIKEE